MTRVGGRQRALEEQDSSAYDKLLLLPLQKAVSGGDIVAPNDAFLSRRSFLRSDGDEEDGGEEVETAAYATSDGTPNAALFERQFLVSLCSNLFLIRTVDARILLSTSDERQFKSTLLIVESRIRQLGLQTLVIVKRSRTCVCKQTIDLSS